MRLPTLLSATLTASAVLPSLAAQSLPPDLASERAAYVAWLETAPNSPLAAIAQQPIGNGVRLGPADADIPVPGLGEHRVVERGGLVRLEGGEARVLPRGRPVALGRFTVAASGPPGHGVLTVYGDGAARKGPTYFPYDPALRFEGTLAAPEQRGTVRVLAVDGVETDASEAGTVTVPIGGARVALRVRRIPTGGEESDLEIYFRDATNGDGTYPAGRFVTLIPLGDGRYRLDFNRARNPFCAYSTAYPCPAPWSGNTIPARVEAGERYTGGGLEQPAGAGEAS